MFDRNLMKLSGMPAIMAALVLLAFLQAGCIAAQALALSQAIAGLWAGASLADMVPNIALFAICFAVLQIARFCQETMLDGYSLKQASQLRQRLLQNTFDERVMLASSQGAAVVAVTANEGIEEVQTYIRIIPPKIIGVAAISLPLLVVEYLVDWPSGIILTVMFPVIIFYMVLLGRQARMRAERQYGVYTRLSNRFMDTLRGIEVIKSFGASEEEGESVYTFSEKLRKATMRTLTTATLSSAVLDLCATFGVAAVAMMLAFRLMDGSIVLATGLAALILAPEYFTPIRSFASDFHASLDGKNALAAALSMVQVGTTPEAGEAGGAQDGALPREGGELCEGERVCAKGKPCEGEEPFAKKELRKSDVPQGVNSQTGDTQDEDARDDVPCAGHDSQDDDQRDNEDVLWSDSSVLEFSGVAYSYGEAGPGVHDVTFTARGFEKIAVIGKSGAGKSTLAKLVAGFIAPDAGSICLDGKPLDVSAASWKRQVRFIPQNPYIFRATLEDNIRFYRPDATREQVEGAVRAVGLEALVAELPQGLDTMVGEGARGLSGGQAHRVALARIFLDDRASVLVFDEPTAHLDIETELELKESMLPLMDGKLVIFATHRLHWIADMDRVVKLDNGTVVGEGVSR